MRVWIDIENPPQVQYLLPIRAAFAAKGADTVITARDYGNSVDMLTRAGVLPWVFGQRVGRGKLRKGAAAVLRARDLRNLFHRIGRPDVLIAASRAAPLAAWDMGVPSFLIIDYEHVHVSLFRITQSTLLYPDVIDGSVFRRRGLRAAQLVPFKGIKEDLTFAGVDVDALDAYRLGELPRDAVRFLFRPPSETSHYYRRSSMVLARAALSRLAQAGGVVVFSAREPKQVELLDGLRWRFPPIVLERPAPFLKLLKSVDAVVCAGGTMLREAAYVGIPAYSIFQSEIGTVDRWLEQIGRVTLVTGPEDLSRIAIKPRGPLERLDSNPALLEELVAFVDARAGEPPRKTHSARARSAALT